MSTLQLELRSGSPPDLLSSSNQVVLQRERGGTADLPRLIVFYRLRQNPSFQTRLDQISTPGALSFWALIKLKIMRTGENSSALFLHLSRTLAFIYFEFKKTPKF